MQPVTCSLSRNQLPVVIYPNPVIRGRKTAERQHWTVDPSIGGTGDNDGDVDIEEKITDGERARYFVQVAEQEYILQNATDKPAVLIVRHHVPEIGLWTPTRNPSAWMAQRLCSR
jgi:hypothetical protein